VRHSLVRCDSYSRSCVSEQADEHGITAGSTRPCVPAYLSISPASQQQDCITSPRSQPSQLKRAITTSNSIISSISGKRTITNST
jgi:hypothetical protein